MSRGRRPAASGRQVGRDRGARVPALATFRRLTGGAAGWRRVSATDRRRPSSSPLGEPITATREPRLGRARHSPSRPRGYLRRASPPRRRRCACCGLGSTVLLVAETIRVSVRAIALDVIAQILGTTPLHSQPEGKSVPAFRPFSDSLRRECRRALRPSSRRLHSRCGARDASTAEPTTSYARSSREADRPAGRHAA